MSRLRQNVAVKEALKTQGKTAAKSMRKTMSVPNFSNVMKSSFSSDNLAAASSIRIKTSMSVQVNITTAFSYFRHSIKNKVVSECACVCVCVCVCVCGVCACVCVFDGDRSIGGR